MSEIVLAALVLFFAAGIPPDPAAPPAERGGARVFAALAELDRAAATPLWPGFDPREIPFEISDGGRTWLLRHPNPPEGFEPVPGHPPSEARVFEGRHDSARANTSAELGGVATAQASFEGKTAGPRDLAALLGHEAFHVFQGRRHPKWGADESQLFLFPVEDAEALALRRLESAALSRAVRASDRGSRERWAARALDARRLRFARLPAAAAAYERGTEQKEGLARYVETRVTGASTAALPAAEFPPAAVRDRAYESGCTIALLLDSLDPRWKETLEASDSSSSSLSLDELLARAVAGVSAADVAPAEMAAYRRRAAQDAAAWTASRADLRRKFLGAPGWRIVVESDSPLFPQGFDPLNIERIPPSEVLHTRFVKLGNAEGSLEVLDRPCLTEARTGAAHPLFEGVRRATVTGLAREPEVEPSENGPLRVRVSGLTLEFRHARVSRTRATITISVGEPAAATGGPGI